MDKTAPELLDLAKAKGIDIDRYGPDISVMAQEAGPRNLWAVRWWSLHLLHQGLCLRPPTSLACHVGWGEHATTTTPGMAFWKDPPLGSPPERRDWPLPVEHPACPELWQRAILCSGAGPFPEHNGVRPRRAAEFEAIYQSQILQDQIGWTTDEDGEEIFSLIRALIHRAGVSHVARVLEFGCGDGNLTWRLALAGFQVVGVDVSPTALALARRRLQDRGLTADFRQVNALRGPVALPIGSVDVVIDSLLLHNLIGIDRQDFLDRSMAALKPGGCLVVVTMCGWPKSEALAKRFDPRTRVVFDGRVAELTFAEPATIAAELIRAGFLLDYQNVIPARPNGEDLFVAIARRAAYSA
jgi:SAM-dependent methyltransferase